MSGRQGAQALVGAVLILSAAPGAATTGLEAAGPVIAAGAGGVPTANATDANVGLPAHQGFDVPAPALPIVDAGTANAAALSEGSVPAQLADASAAATLARVASDPATAMLLAAGIALPAVAAFLRRRHRRRIAWGLVERRDIAGRGWNWA